MKQHHAIFDLDGVLLDTEPLYTQATAEVVARFAKVYEWSLKSQCIGRGTYESARIIVDALALPLTPQELVTARDVILRVLLESAQPMRGAVTFTRELAARGVRMAIATSTQAALFAHKAAPHKAWLGSFEAIICGDDPRVKRSKPAPDIFLAAADALGLSPAECTVFEDSPFGVAGALAAGMRVVALPDPAMDRELYRGAHLVVSGFDELIASIDTLGFSPPHLSP